MSIFKTFWLLWVASKGTRGAWVQVVGEFGSSSITSCKERAACPLGGVCDGWGAALPRADVAMLKDATCLPLGLSGK